LEFLLGASGIFRMLSYLSTALFRGGFLLPKICFFKKRKRGKKMKTRILSLALALVLVVMAMTSCGLLWGEVAEGGDVTVVIENADGTYEVYKTYLEDVENKQEGAKGVIEHLSERENNPLYLEMVDSTYGAYVSAIGSIKEDGDSSLYVMVYTSVTADSYEGAPTLDYEGITMHQAGLGLSGMSVEEGTVILFRLEASPW
jgi:hypothetical protein